MLPTLVIDKSIFQSFWDFFPRKVWLLIISTEGILFQTCKTPTFETWTTSRDVIMTSPYLKNSFAALKTEQLLQLNQILNSDIKN